MNKYTNLFVSLLLLLSVAAYAEPEREGSLLPNKDAAKLRYVPDRVIVKLRQERLLAGKTPKSALDIKYKDRKDYDERTLNSLKLRHRIKSHAPVFNGLHRAMAANELSVRECNLQQNLRFRQRMRRIKTQAAAPDLFPVYVLNTEKTEDIDALCNELNADPDVEYAQPDYIQTIALTPNDPYYTYTISPGWPYSIPWGQKLMWAIERINARIAWDDSNGHSLGEGVVVAVIDSGVDYTHEDLRENMWINPKEVPGDGIDNDGNGCPDDIYGFDFGSSVDANGDGDYVDAGDTADSNPYDEYMHGTLMAGTIAAVVNNNIGIYGVAPRAKIMALKACTPDGDMPTSLIVRAIDYAVRNGADVVNNSYGYSTPVPSNPALENAVRNAYNSGVVMVFAAGNNNDIASNYSPRQMLNEVITVAGTTEDNDGRYWASNYGAMVDVAAPAYGIFSCNTSALVGLIFPDRSYNSKYLASEGTSFAAAHVSGLAALLLAKSDKLSPADIEQVICQNAAPITPAPDQPIGTGRIDALATLNDVSSTDHIAITRTVFANDQLKVYAIMRRSTPSEVTLSWKYSNSSTGETVGTVTPPAVNEEFLAGTIVHRGFNNRIINLKIQAGSLTNETSFYYSRLYGLEFIDWTDQRINLLGNDKYYLQATLLGTTWTSVNVDYKKSGDTVWQTAGVNVLWQLPIDHDINCNLICEVDAGYISQAGSYTFRITAQASGGGNPYTVIATVPVEVDSSTMRGWPVYAKADVGDHQPLAIDFDGDGDLEICINTWNSGTGRPGLQILHHDGLEDRRLSPYHSTLNFSSGSRGLSAYDIDNTCGEEILLPLEGYKLHIFEGSNGTLSEMSPWPCETSDWYKRWYEDAPPVFADINNDRINEIIGIYGWDLSDYYLTALDLGKNVLFSVKLPHHAAETGELIHTILTCDIDNDGKKEIIVPTQAGSSQVPYLRAYNDNGTECIGNGWPVNLRALSSKNADYLDEYCAGPIRLADVNTDGSMEIIFANYLQEIFVLKKNGAILAGWPRDTKGDWMYPGDIAIGNLNGDKNPEIVAIQGSYINVFKANGTPLVGWPKVLSNLYPGNTSCSFGTPLIADVNNDEQQEILVNGWVYTYEDQTRDRFILSFSGDGTMLNRWELHGSSSFDPGIVIADIDKDGILELIGIGDLPSPPSPDLATIPTLSRIFVWKLDGSDSTSHLDWPMYKADTQRTASWFPWGDVNTDGKVDVIDAQACINQFLGIQNWGKRADVKNDGGVNILDIQQLVNIILGV